VEVVLALVVIATTVAASARRIRVPAPSLLVLAGLLIALIPGVPEIRLAPDLVSLVILPPLLYAAGQDLPWRELRPVAAPVTVLALGLVLASAAAVGLVAAAVTPLPGSLTFVLGAVLASTDPVAVTALGRRLALPARLQALIQAESLFNDATSLVLFRVAVAAAVAGGAVSWVGGIGEFALLAGGGVLIGVCVAGGAALFRRRTEDPVLETVIALVTPYVGYIAAEEAGVSGIMAVVVASVILAGHANRLTSGQIRLQVHAVYETVVFLLESVVFGLIGLQLPALIRAAGDGSGRWLLQAGAVAVTLIAIRAVWVFPLWVVVAGRSRLRERRSWAVPVVVSWAGARGVLPLAAALSVPLSVGSGRDLVLLLTTAVIVGTLLVQGFTLGPLVRAAGVALPAGHVANEEATALTAMARAALDRLDEVENVEAAPEAAVTQLRQLLRARVDGTDGTLAEPDLRQLRRDLIDVESMELSRLYQEGTIGAETRRALQRRLDLEGTSLDD
jgi:CPA1 family monovalent cation:H+ antiporter